MKQFNNIQLKDYNQSQLYQITFFNKFIYFLIDKQTIGFYLFGQEDIVKLQLNSYLNEEEEIIQLKHSQAQNFQLLAILVNKNRLLFFQTSQDKNEELEFYYEFKIQENEIVNQFYWKKNKLYYGLQNQIQEINFKSFKDNKQENNSQQIIDNIPTVSKIIETENEIIFWDCSQVTDLFYILQENKILIVNSVNSIIYEYGQDNLDFKILNLKAFRQNLQIEPLTENNFLNYNYCLKDLLILQSDNSKIQVLDIGKMKSKNNKEIKICTYDIYQKFNLPEFANYEQIYITNDNKYLVMLNQQFHHIIVFKINETFATAQNHEKDFKNVYPFFQQIACITYPKETLQINFKIENGEKNINQLLQTQKKDIKDVLIAAYYTSTGFKISVVPLDIIFQIQEEIEENNVSRIELDELSIIENDNDKYYQKKKKVLKDIPENKQDTKYKMKQGQIVEVKEEQLYYKKVENKKSNDKVNNKQDKKLVISNPIDYLENTNKKKAKIERKLQQHKSNSIKMQEMKDGTSKMSNVQKKEDFDDLFDNLELKKNVDNKLEFDVNIENQIQNTVKNFEQNLRQELDKQLKSNKLQFNKEFGSTFHRFLDKFQDDYQKDFQENNEQVLFPLIEQSFKIVFEKHTQELNDVYLDYQKKIETTISMQNNLKYNLENVFTKREKNNNKLSKALDKNFKILEQLQIKKSSDDFVIQNMKKKIDELQENQALFLDQIEEISKYVHELENKISLNNQKMSGQRDATQPLN